MLGTEHTVHSPTSFLKTWCSGHTAGQVSQHCWGVGPLSWRMNTAADVSLQKWHFAMWKTPPVQQHDPLLGREVHRRLRVSLLFSLLMLDGKHTQALEIVWMWVCVCTRMHVCVWFSVCVCACTVNPHYSQSPYLRIHLLKFIWNHKLSTAGTLMVISRHAQSCLHAPSQLRAKKTTLCLLVVFSYHKQVSFSWPV